MDESRRLRHGSRSGATRDGQRAPRALDPSWSPELVPAIARTFGLTALGDHHWKVIMSCREEAARTGHAPEIRQLESLTGFDAEELHRLFPGDFAALLARVSGIAPPA